MFILSVGAQQQPGFPVCKNKEKCPNICGWTNKQLLKFIHWSVQPTNLSSDGSFCTSSHICSSFLIQDMLQLVRTCKGGREKINPCSVIIGDQW